MRLRRDVTAFGRDVLLALADAKIAALRDAEACCMFSLPMVHAGLCSAGACAPYCTALIMSKIGRYIATTIPPTITPRNTIITGSIRLRSPLTAVSTSVS
jgi:hypothetical protein